MTAVETVLILGSQFLTLLSPLSSELLSPHPWGQTMRLSKAPLFPTEYYAVPVFSIAKSQCMTSKIWCLFESIHIYDTNDAFNLQLFIYNEMTAVSSFFMVVYPISASASDIPFDHSKATIYSNFSSLFNNCLFTNRPFSQCLDTEVLLSHRKKMCQWHHVC